MSQDTSQFERSSLDRAWQLYHLKKFDLALVETNHFVAQLPKSPEGQYLLAWIHSAQGKKGLALKAARKCVTLSPNWGMAYYVYGQVALQFGEIVLATECGKDALRFSPTDSNVYSLLAGICNAQGDSRVAIEYANKGLEFDPRHEYCLLEKAMALLEMNREDEAETSFRELLEVNPSHGAALAYIGKFETETGNHQQGEHLLQYSLNMDPRWELAQKLWRQAKAQHYAVYRIPKLLKDKVFFVNWRRLIEMFVMAFLMIIVAAIFKFDIFVEFLAIGVAIIFFGLFVMAMLLSVYLHITINLLSIVDKKLRRTWSIRSLTEIDGWVITFLILVLYFILLVIILVVIQWELVPNLVESGIKCGNGE